MKKQEKKTRRTSPYTDYSQVQNVDVKWSKNKLTIEIDLNQDFGPTKKRKNIKIASTNGQRLYNGDDAGLGCFLALTVYREE